MSSLKENEVFHRGVYRLREKLAALEVERGLPEGTIVVLVSEFPVSGDPPKARISIAIDTPDIDAVMSDVRALQVSAGSDDLKADSYCHFLVGDSNSKDSIRKRLREFYGAGDGE